MTNKRALEIANEVLATLTKEGEVVINGDNAGVRLIGEGRPTFLFPFKRHDPQSIAGAVRAGFEMAFSEARVRALWPITCEKLIAWGNAWPFKGNAEGMVEIKDEHGSFWVGSETAQRWAKSNVS